MFLEGHVSHGLGPCSFLNKRSGVMEQANKKASPPASITKSYAYLSKKLPVTKAIAAAINQVPTPTSCFTLLLTTCKVVKITYMR